MPKKLDVQTADKKALLMPAWYRPGLQFQKMCAIGEKEMISRELTNVPASNDCNHKKSFIEKCSEENQRINFKRNLASR